MPLSEFDHVEKGDALYGEFGFLFFFSLSLMKQSYTRTIEFLFIGPYVFFVDVFCNQWLLLVLLLSTWTMV